MAALKAVDQDSPLDSQTKNLLLMLLLYLLSVADCACFHREFLRSDRSCDSDFSSHYGLIPRTVDSVGEYPEFPRVLARRFLFASVRLLRGSAHQYC
jgi:hypothetical protein